RACECGPPSRAVGQLAGKSSQTTRNGITEFFRCTANEHAGNHARIFKKLPATKKSGRPYHRFQAAPPAPLVPFPFVPDAACRAQIGAHPYNVRAARRLTV